MATTTISTRNPSFPNLVSFSIEMVSECLNFDHQVYGCDCRACGRTIAHSEDGWDAETDEEIRQEIVSLVEHKLGYCRILRAVEDRATVEAIAAARAVAADEPF